MRIFSATEAAWSSSSSLRPRWPARPAQNKPAAPAPTTMASKRSRVRRGAGFTVECGVLTQKGVPVRRSSFRVAAS